MPILAFFFVLRFFLGRFRRLQPNILQCGRQRLAVEHTGVRKRQREGTLEKVAKYDKEAFERAYAWMAPSPSDEEDD